MTWGQLVDTVAFVLEAVGMAIIAIGFIYALAIFVVGGMRDHRWEESYIRVRAVLGRALLLSLEILIGADIIKTIVLEPTVDNLMALGLLVLVRTFLSWSIDVEIEGAWPWQRRRIEDEERHDRLAEDSKPE